MNEENERRKRREENVEKKQNVKKTLKKSLKKSIKNTVGNTLSFLKRLKNLSSTEEIKLKSIMALFDKKDLITPKKV